MLQVENFMTLDECSYIIEMARNKMDRSTIAEASETEAKNGVVRAVAVCCSVLQRVASLKWREIKWTAVPLWRHQKPSQKCRIMCCCSVLQCVAVCCIIEMARSRMHHCGCTCRKWRGMCCCSVLQCVVVCCIVLQRVAACCSVLHS